MIYMTYMFSVREAPPSIKKGAHFIFTLCGGDFYYRGSATKFPFPNSDVCLLKEGCFSFISPKYIVIWKGVKMENFRT